MSAHIETRHMTSDDVLRFYSAHDISQTCNYCGNSDWAVEFPRDGSLWTLPSAAVGPDGYALSKAAPVVMLICTRCFGLRLHSHKLMQQWLDDNPVAGDLT